MFSVFANSLTNDNQRLAIVLGLLTLLAGLAAFFSCRIGVNWLNRLGIKNPGGNRIYAVPYNQHLYYWWAFGVLMVAHLMVAAVHTGLPRAGEPNASIHWWILATGLFSSISALIVFFSCRVMPRLMTMAKPSNPFTHHFYDAFFKRHSVFWLCAALLAAAHFWLAFSHSGIWPGG